MLVKERKNLTPHEAEFVLFLMQDRTIIGDMYEYVSQIEIGMHDLIRSILQKEFGVNENQMVAQRSSLKGPRKMRF